MINNMHDFKNQTIKYLSDACAIASAEDEKKKNIVELIRIIELMNCDVVYEMNTEKDFEREIDLNGIINILSHSGKIKKLSEVDFDE